jgi:hypothetical protein
VRRSLMEDSQREENAGKGTASAVPIDLQIWTALAAEGLLFEGPPRTEKKHTAAAEAAIMALMAARLKAVPFPSSAHK